MQLLQAKIRCLKHVADSGWFKPGRKLTILTGPRKESVSEVLRGLEVLNPLYEVEQIKPFADHPRTWQQGSYRRQVVREKKTAVTAVFSSNPSLVQALARLDDSLIQTDRIELGRRLDYSRWVSFVELPASARWSDISEKISALTDAIEDSVNSANATNGAFIESCRNSDRIKGPLAQKCRDWLIRHSSNWSGEQYNLYRECLHEVDLHERFKLANRLIKEYLPPIVRLGPELLLRKEYRYAEFADGDSSEKDPVTLLLKGIFDRFHLVRPTREILERLNMRMQEVASRYMIKMPGTTSTFEKEGFFSGYSPKENRQLDKRIKYIRLVCFLSEILCSRAPFLLLDGYDKGLTDMGRREFADFLSIIAERTQVLLQPDKLEWCPESPEVKKILILSE